ncbi:T9SS type A sorting domain-containing protein [Hymenobacter gummosus]|uniref:T9SS type A sorting domain-containing protein n=1 Tax=Hymenobacter gummosus TaxID=1776032 RepID=UPI0014050F86|nr:T9SS type A sorting domain-containing protein [Hymenobacter gummosus]
MSRVSTPFTPGAASRYYRLRQVDRDGSTEYSPVVAVTVAGAAAASCTAYPNPFADELYVALPAGTEPQPATAVLTTLTGQPVLSAPLQPQAAPQRLSLPGLAPGIYVLRLTTAAGTTTQRISHR